MSNKTDAINLWQKIIDEQGDSKNTGVRVGSAGLKTIEAIAESNTDTYIVNLIAMTASAPTSANDGEYYYNTSDKNIYIRNYGAWSVFRRLGSGDLYTFEGLFYIYNPQKDTLEILDKDTLDLKMQYIGDYDVIPYAIYKVSDVYKWKGELYIVKVAFTTSPISPPEDFHDPSDTEYWTQLTGGYTITTQNKLDNFRPKNGFALVSDIASLAPYTGDIANKVIVRNYSIGGTTTEAGNCFQEFTNEQGNTYRRRFGNTTNWGAWEIVTYTPSQHNHSFNSLVDVDWNTEVTVPQDSYSLPIRGANGIYINNISIENLNEVHVGGDEPTHNEILWIDTASSESTSFVSHTGATISPDFNNLNSKYDSNYAGGNTVALNSYTYLPTFDDEREVIIKNTNASDRIFAPTTTPQVSGGITYTFILMNTNTITVPTGKHLEISYKFLFDSASTCRVLILWAIQG
jgi:hypothetical protein